VVFKQVRYGHPHNKGEKMDRKLLVQQVLNLMGLKQKELALIMKVDDSAVSKWVHGVDYFDDLRVFQLKSLVEKNLGKQTTDYLFSNIINEIEKSWR